MSTPHCRYAELRFPKRDSGAIIASQFGEIV
jgi:hypothetical protein